MASVRQLGLVLLAVTELFDSITVLKVRRDHAPFHFNDVKVVLCCIGL